MVRFLWIPSLEGQGDLVSNKHIQHEPKSKLLKGVT